MFRVGQKVVCVDASGAASPFIIKGGIYTIAGFDARRASNSDRPGLFLAEVDSTDRGRYYGSFLANRFRPVVERKTDISIFKAMLNPSNLREEV